MRKALIQKSKGVYVKKKGKRLSLVVVVVVVSMFTHIYLNFGHFYHFTEASTVLPTNWENKLVISNGKNCGSHESDLQRKKTMKTIIRIKLTSLLIAVVTDSFGSMLWAVKVTYLGIRSAHERVWLVEEKPIWLPRAYLTRGDLEPARGNVHVCKLVRELTNIQIRTVTAERQ